MITQFELYTDSQLIDALVERFGWKQVEIANRFTVTEAAVSMARSGKNKLRSTLRKAMIEQLRQLEDQAEN